MEIFTLNLIYKIYLSACFTLRSLVFYATPSNLNYSIYFKDIRIFIERLIPSIRFFDMSLWTVMRNVQPRTSQGESH